MKILLPILSFVMSLANFTVGESGYIISSYAYLYTQPSFSSEKVSVDGEVVTLLHGQEFIIEEENGDFVYISLSYQQKEINGYVYKFYITDTTSQEVYPVFNGKVRREAILYDKILNDGLEEYEDSGYSLYNGQEVYIYNGYDSSEEYTAVQVVLEDGSLYNGYIRTEDLEPQGISPLLITGITIIAACVTVTLSIVFIKKIKKSKK